MAPNDDHAKLFKRLYTLGRRYYRCAPDLAEDAASDAICSAMEAGVLSYKYCAASVRNYISEYYRNRRTRNEDYRQPIGSDGLPQDFPEGAVPAPQDLHMVARECVAAIGDLPPKIQDVMRYAAREYTADEISRTLNLPKSEVQWRIKYGRKLMRQRDGYGMDRKRGHHQYIGIRKRHHKWEASIKVNDAYVYLGHFDTASDAAKAYDERAKELLGEKANLNFPTATNR